MAANTQAGSSEGRTIYYNISYGMLSTKVKEAPAGYTEVSEAELKSKTQAVENIDLRSKFINKNNGKDYPIVAFFNDITGNIVSVEKDEYDKGISLKVTIQDTDGDTCVLGTKFYGKTGSDFMNRLLALQGKTAIKFTPYQIPTENEIEGKKIKYYNMGVSLKEGGEKIKGAFNKDNGLPLSERVQNSEGQMVTSRVKLINFLWEKLLTKYNTPTGESQTVTTQKPVSQSKPDAKMSPKEVQDLPF